MDKRSVPMITDDIALSSLTNNNPLGYKVRLVEPIVFAVCNTDGVEGLSWAEVEQCEVSKKIWYKGPFLYYVRVKGWVGGIAKYLLFLTGVGGWFWITLM